MNELATMGHAAELSELVKIKDPATLVANLKMTKQFVSNDKIYMALTEMEGAPTYAGLSILTTPAGGAILSQIDLNLYQAMGISPADIVADIEGDMGMTAEWKKHKGDVGAMYAVWANSTKKEFTPTPAHKASVISHIYNTSGDADGFNTTSDSLLNALTDKKLGMNLDEVGKARRDVTNHNTQTAINKAYAEGGDDQGRITKLIQLKNSLIDRGYLFNPAGLDEKIDALQKDLAAKQVIEAEATAAKYLEDALAGVGYDPAFVIDFGDFSGIQIGDINY